ncbi:MAG: hypothetical protein CGW95_14230, partial [Phenylobacterium zucineum]
MNIKKSLAVVSAFVLALTVGLTAPPSAASANDGGSQGQNGADHADQFNGGWDGTAIGLDARPYVTSLTIDGVSQLTDVPQSPTDDFWASPVRAAIYAFNSCPTGKTPDSGECYADPNRIGITMGYGNGDSIATNFASDSAAEFGITTNSMIDLTVQMNGFKGALGWTWLSGHP